MFDYTEEFQGLANFLQDKKRILIATHESPDGDALGSSLGLSLGLKTLGKETTVFCKDAVPERFLFLPESYNLSQSQPSVEVDTVFGLDYGNKSRLNLGAYFQKFPHVPFVTIDHHPKIDQDGIFRVIDVEASSCSEIVFQFLKVLGVSISRDMALNLLTGIYTDTGGFSHVATTSATLVVASELVLKGCPLSGIAKKVTPRSFDFVPVWGRILSRLAVDSSTGMASSWLSRQDLEELSIQPQNLEGVATVLASAAEARFSLFLLESGPKLIEASLRSEPFKQFEVHKIAEKFGGGGHKYAAGFRKNGEIKGVLEEVRKVVSETKLV